MIYKFLNIFAISMLLSFSAFAGEDQRESGWADIVEFCSTENLPENICVDLLTRYQEATKNHFRAMSADSLRRISNEINALAEDNSEQAKKMREAVKNIGDTLRKPIEIPSGVRILNRTQQQYIQQTEPPATVQ